MDLQSVKECMEKRGFTVSIFENTQEAATYLTGSIQNTTVGSGGSMTLEALNIYDTLCSNNTVYWRSKCTNAEENNAAVMAPVYLTSANGVTESGILLNIDATANRIAATSYGKERLIYVIGVNKISPTLEEALHRAKHIAAPLNAKRLGRKTPCAVKADKCYDCNSPERICNMTCYTERKPGSIAKLEVLIVKEDLGL